MSEIITILKELNVLTIICASILGERISELLSSTVDDIILPIINRDANNDGIADIVKLEDKILQIYNVKLKIGKIVVITIKIIIMLCIIYGTIKIANYNNIV